MLDQWNRVTTNIGTVANGKTLSKLDIGYDQPANTGGYRGYVDDLSLTNPTSSTPLWSSTLESGDPQPTWTSTVDTGPESGSGKSSNVGGICCGLTGPELATRQELAHADGATLPARSFTYTSLDNSYVDSFFHPNPSTNCGPSWNTGNGSGCLLWAQSHANNDRYLASVSNGMGLAETFSWSLARDNTHGVPGGGSNNADPLYCNSHQSGYPCNEADDGGWSRVVLSQQSSTTVRLTQNGQGGAQTSTPVTSTTNYIYQLSYPLVAQQCSDCVAGMYWGNQNDVDYLGYYNGKFMGFTQVTVSHADGSVEVHKYFGTKGWGIYDTGQANCGTPNPCHNDPWWDLTNAAHGHETETFFYDTDGTTLLKHTTASYQAVCPPSGVSGTPASSIFGNFDGKLVSALDDSNPVAVCDVQQTQQVEQVSNGTANNVITTTSWTYDNFGRVLQETITSNGGTPGTVVHQYAYVWNDAIGYDFLGRMTSETLPAETSGTTKTWSYTTWCSGTAAQAPCVELDETDRMNATTTVTTRGFYDGEGRLVETRVSGPNNQDVVTYVNYDVMGRKIFTSNPYFVAAYTGPAGPAAFSLPDSSQPGSSTSYPTLRQTNLTDALSQTTTTTASVQCGVSGTSDTGCYVLSAIIDANSHQRSTLTDGMGHEAYDLRYTGNSSGTYALYALTSYTYDVNDNLLTIKHPANNATSSFTYDAAGRQIGLNDPDRGIVSIAYDPNSNMTQSVDARGSAGTVFTGYDGLNRSLRRNTTNSPTGARVTYSYDSTANGNMGVGRKTGETFSGSGGLSGSYAFVYDQRGQQTSMTTTINGTAYPVQASYDDAGDLIGQTYPTGEVVNATYSAQGWLTQLTTTSGGTTTTLASNIAYTGTAGAAMHITGMSLGNGVYSYGASYDLDQRLTSSSLTRSSDSTLLYQTQPGYDAVGNVSSVTTTLQAGTDNQHFYYDEQNRLTWAWSNGNSPCGSFTAGTLTSAQYQQSYTYDTNGRLTSAQSGYTYDDSSHLHAVTSTGNGYSAAYDAAGNVTCRAPSRATTCSGTQTGQQLSYDAEGNLSTWQNQPTPTSTVNYLYDGEGTRVASQLVSGGNTTLTSYLGKLETIVAGSSSTTTTYYYAGALRIAEAVNGTFSYLGSDVLGSTAVALNAAGQLTAAQLYGPYGNVRYSSGTMPTDIGFTGQRGDSATGLDYYNARYYDPVVGLFISADTVLPGKGFNPWGLSRYAYVQGNPETMTDPTGQRWANADGSETAWLNPVTGGLYTSTKESWIYGGGYKIDYYTPKELKNPWYDPLKDTQNSTAAKVKRSLGITDLQKTLSNPHASTWDKTVAVGRMLMKNADNLLMVGMILGGPEDDAVLGGEAQLESTVVDDGFKMTQTVMNHVDDLRQTTREVGGVTRFFIRRTIKTVFELAWYKFVSKNNNGR